MLQLILYWPRPCDLPRASPRTCFLPPKINIKKSKSGVSGYIRSLASILFIKSRLHQGSFPPLHNSQYHFIKSLPNLIWVRALSLWMKVIISTISINNRLKGAGFNHFPVIKCLKCTFIRPVSCFHHLLKRRTF